MAITAARMIALIEVANAMRDALIGLREAGRLWEQQVHAGELDPNNIPGALVTYIDRLAPSPYALATLAEEEKHFRKNAGHLFKMRQRMADLRAGERPKRHRAEGYHTEPHAPTANATPPSDKAEIARLDALFAQYDLEQAAKRPPPQIMAPLPEFHISQGHNPYENDGLAIPGEPQDSAENNSPDSAEGT